MIKQLHLKFGGNATEKGISIDMKPSITIFVGPNNSGKSLLLREIRDFCSNGSKGDHTLILDRLEFEGVDENTAQQEMEKIKRTPSFGEHINPNQIPVRIGDADTQIHPQHYLACRQEPNSLLNFYCSYYLAPMLISLDGQTRIGLLNETGMGNLKLPSSPLAKIFVNNEKRTVWREVVHKAFDLFPGIDATEGGKLSVRFGKTAPPGERGLEDDIVNWMKNARHVGEVSDGVKAFSGILLQLFAGDPKIIIVDEPEAFLHPSLARTLGQSLASAARTENKYVFAATHSAEFLMGAIQSGATVNIIRLTHGKGGATARLLKNENLKKLMNDPMLRSVGVLTGLFFDHVIVSEADADRAFYQEVNDRLLDSNDHRGLPHALFLNADNKDTIPHIIEPLRKLGIPAAGIVDVDVVSEGGGKWTKHLNCIGVPQAQHQASHALRKTVYDKLTECAPPGTAKPGKYCKTNGGVNILGEYDREAANNLFDELERYGLFVVRRGEVESWLGYLSLPSKEAGWRSAIFDAMGNDPSGVGYAKPQEGDVWDFIGSIAKWMRDPKRRGMG